MSVAEPQSSTNPQLRPGHQQEGISGSFTGQPAHRPQQAPAAPAHQQTQPAGGQPQPSQQAVLSGQHQSVQGLLTGPRVTQLAGGPAWNPHSTPQLVAVPVHQAQQAGHPTPPSTMTPAATSTVQAVGPTHHQGVSPAGAQLPQAVVDSSSTQQQQQQQVPASGAAVASGAPDCASLAALTLQQQQQPGLGAQGDTAGAQQQQQQQQQQHFGSDDDLGPFAAAAPPSAAAQAGQQQQQQPPAVAGQGFPDAALRVLLGCFARDGSYLTPLAAAAQLRAQADALEAMHAATDASSDEQEYLSQLGGAVPEGLCVHLPGVQPAQQQVVPQTTAMLHNAAAPADTLWTPINICDRSDFTILDFTGGELGAGSFGTVRQGSWQGVPVAVKFLKTNIKRLRPYLEAERRAALVREAQLQANAKHPHIAALNAVWCPPPSAGSHEHYAALIMEPCQCSLADRILNCWDQAADRVPQRHAQWAQQQHPEPSWPLTIKLLKHASAALWFLHKPGPGRAIFHNDVRAANMLLKLVWEDGKAAWELKLCDFGLACEAGTRRAVEVETVTNREWLAPELDTSCRTLEDGRVVRRVTAATDIFSLGCVMHEMAWREGPMRSKPNGELHEDLLKSRLRDQTRGITDRFRELFRDCVAADVYQRPCARCLYDGLNEC